MVMIDSKRHRNSSGAEPRVRRAVAWQIRDQVEPLRTNWVLLSTPGCGSVVVLDDHMTMEQG